MLIELFYVLGCFLNFWVYLGGDSFSRRSGKLGEIRNVEENFLFLPIKQFFEEKHLLPNIHKNLENSSKH